MIVVGKHLIEFLIAWWLDISFWIVGIVHPVHTCGQFPHGHFVSLSRSEPYCCTDAVDNGTDKPSIVSDGRSSLARSVAAFFPTSSPGTPSIAAIKT